MDANKRTMRLDSWEQESCQQRGAGPEAWWMVFSSAAFIHFFLLGGFWFPETSYLMTIRSYFHHGTEFLCVCNQINIMTDMMMCPAGPQIKAQLKHCRKSIFEKQQHTAMAALEGDSDVIHPPHITFPSNIHRMWPNRPTSCSDIALF